MRPDRTLEVVAPPDADEAAILERIANRAQWIARAWRRCSPPPALETQVRGYGFFPAETHWYLGRAYRLKMRSLPASSSAANSASLSLFDTPEETPPHSNAPNENITLEDRFLWISAHHPTPAKIESLLGAWYRARAYEVFAVWIEKCLRQSRSLELASPPVWEVRRMAKRWGSCTASGKILLNVELVKMPVDCIEYVVLHELCHLKHPHHGPTFYMLLSRFLPDWKARKAKLEEWGEKI